MSDETPYELWPSVWLTGEGRGLAGRQAHEWATADFWEKITAPERTGIAAEIRLWLSNPLVATRWWVHRLWSKRKLR